jgi:asparagine synthase (glutamine-hydrolysing)
LRGRMIAFVRQLNAWATRMGRSWTALLQDAVRGFLFQSTVCVLQSEAIAPWFAAEFVHRNLASLRGYPSRLKLFGALPSFQNYMRELNHIRRFLAFCGLHSGIYREKRYPYLDRDLLAFVFAIPRQQLVRVGQRRSLMRRALVGTVPQAILNRKKIPPPPQNIQQPSPRLIPNETGDFLISSSVGIVDEHRFAEALHRTRAGEGTPAESLMLTLKLESWLRNLNKFGVLRLGEDDRKRQCHPAHRHEAHVQFQELG